MFHPSLVIAPILTLTSALPRPTKREQREWGINMRQLFLLFGLVFALVTTAAATVVTTDVISDSAIAQQASR